MPDSKMADPNLVHRIATGYMGTCVLLAALELNIFDNLTDRSMTSQEMADTLGLDPKPVERLMDFFRKCYDKLPGGGAIVIHDFLMNNDYRGPLLAGLYNLTSVEGVPLSGQDMSKRLERAGFVNLETRKVIPEYTGLVTAKKP